MAAIRFTLLFFLSFYIAAEPALNLWQDATPSKPSPFESNIDEFLPVEEVFHAFPSLENNNLVVRWTALPKHYLYKSRFKFDLGPIKTKAAIFPEGLLKHDEYFGEVEVFYDEVNIVLPLQEQTSEIPAGTIIELTSQGCADAGLCYPPYSLKFQWQNNQWLAFDGSQAPQQNAPITKNTAKSTTTDGQLQSDSSSISDDYWKNQLEASDTFWTLILFFLAGVGLTFTPCVLPMVPILSSIIIGQKDPTKTKAFILSSVYVLAMAITYAVAGAITGYFGAEFNLQAKLQSPYVLIPFSVLFVALAFSMFGYYELQLPSAIQNKLTNTSQQQKSGSLWGVAVMGVLSALIVSPCVSAPLIGALVFISSSGDALLGASALLSLGLGMGLPLLFIGVFGAHLLPKAGMWMEKVKAFFGILLLAVALWFIERLLPGPMVLALWSLLAIGTGLFFGAFNNAASSGIKIVGRALGIFLVVYGAVLLIGALQGNENPLKPLSLSGASSPASSEIIEFETVFTTQALDDALTNAAKNQKPVLLDVYADWCISCKVIEREVFQTPAVAKRLAKFALIKYDITEVTKEHQQWLNDHKLFGPPVYLFFDDKGNKMTEAQLVGEFNQEQFLHHLDRFGF